MTARILVVEDQPAMQRNIRMGLEMVGYEVVTASDGCGALKALDGQPIDLILADVAMPRMNGYQLYQELRRNPRWALVPFVFLSARALDSDVRFGKSLGADDYLVKPFDLQDLLAVVAGRLQRARELAQAVGATSGGPTSAVSTSVVSTSVAPRSREAAPAENDVVAAGPLRMNPRQHRAWKDGAPVELSPSEFAFLEYLVRRPGQAIPLTELCKVTHGLDADPVEAGSLLYPLVRSLRRRLGNPPGEMGCIESVRGIGYRLNTDV